MVGRINYSIQPDSAYTTGTTNQKTLVSDPGVDEKMRSDEREREREREMTISSRTKPRSDGTSIALND